MTGQVDGKKRAILEVILGQKRDSSYQIVLGQGLMEELAQALVHSGWGQKYALICDHVVQDLYGEQVLETLRAKGLQVTLFSFPAGETNKNLETFRELLEQLQTAHFTRKDCILALGGGVVGDLAGFVAGCYMRGISFVQVPTTLLAQVDASVGGKVAVNLRQGKNYCGLFYQPRSVYIDLDFLQTLSQTELLNGLGEVVKYALLADASLYGFLKDKAGAIMALDGQYLLPVIKRCVEIKAQIVAQDEKEAGLRMVLNYGHTVGHALEAYFDYHLPHGLAVAYGLRVAAELGYLLGLIDSDVVQAHRLLLQAFGLAQTPLDPDLNKVYSLMLGDKKADAQGLTMILPTGLGQVEVRYNIPQRLILTALKQGLGPV